MSTIEITRVEDVREGDVVTVELDGTTVTGRVSSVSRGSNVHLDVAHLLFTAIVSADWWTFVRATREVPDLPTEPGSVIVNATIRGRGAAGPQRMSLAANRLWYSLDGTVCAVDEIDITAWTPARIVPEDGAS